MAGFEELAECARVGANESKYPIRRPPSLWACPKYGSWLRSASTILGSTGVPIRFAPAEVLKLFCHLQ
jgi:hypothetical protein